MKTVSQLLIFFFIFFSSLFADKLNLTSEELDYINTKKEIIVSNELDYEPIDFNILGKPTGYSVDLTQLLLKDTGLKIRYVSKSWSELYEDFKNKEIDLVHTMYKFKQREKDFIFSKGYLRGQDSFIVNKSFPNITKIEELFGKKIGVTKGWYPEIFLKKYPKIQRVYFNNLEEKFEALSRGEIDAVINNKYVSSYFIKKLGFIDLKVLNYSNKELNKKTGTFHFAVNKENALLISIINKAFENASYEDLEKISVKWFGNAEKSIVLTQLTKEEIDYLHSKKVFKMPTYSDWRPFNFVEDGIPNGYLIELSKLIAEKLNIQLEFVNNYSWNEHKQMLLDNEVDFVGNMAKTKDRLKYYLFSTNPSLIVSSSIVSYKNYKTLEDLTSKTLGTIKGSAQETYLMNNYKEIKYKSFDSINDLIQGIINDEVDAILDNYSVLNYQLNRLNLLKDLKINILLNKEGLTLPLHYAVNINNPILLSILNKTIAQIPKDEIEHLKIKWGLHLPSNTRFEEETFVRIFGYRVSTNLAFSFIFILVILFLIIKLLNANQKIKDRSEDIKQNFSSNKTLLFNKYLIGLVIMVMTVIASFITIDLIHENKLDSGKIINLSGKQRMLSQRTTLLASQFLNTKDEKVFFEYKRAVKLMKNDHKIIMKLILDEKIIDFYVNKPNLNAQVLDFIRLNEEFIEAPSYNKLSEIIYFQNILLPTLDKAVFLHENNLANIDGKLTNFIWSFLILLLIVIVLESLYIYNPLLKQITKIAENFQYEKEKVTDISNQQKNLLSLFDKGDSVLFKWKNDDVWSIEYVSNNVKTLFGYSKEEFLDGGLQYGSLIYKDDLKSVLAEVENVKKQNLDFLKHEPYRITTKSGIRKWVLDYTVTVKDENGDISHFIGYIVDVTELKSMTEVLLMSQTSLKMALLDSKKKEKLARNAEEKANLAQEQLADLNEELKYAYEAKSDFLANMSHEIRTPLSGIIGITDIVLENDNLSLEDRKNLEIVKNSSNRLKGIINDILDFSKIQAGKFQIVKEEFSLKNLINDIENLFAAQLKNKRLNFHIKIHDDVEDILVGDELRLNQVITNLLGNSIKFTSNGLIRLEVQTLEKYEDNIKLKVTIKDTGIGMTQKVQESVFEAFTQGELSNTKNFQGTGLGLSISKRLIELMGGEIWFDSVENIGTTFYFILDLKFEKDKEIEKISSNKNLEDITFTNKKVLVAEDSEINQMVIKNLLSKVNINIHIANNGIEAIKLAKENSYDLILMDIQMPEMDGYQATKEIRFFNKEVPIVALSAAVMQEDISQAYEVGMDYHIAKPIDKNELYNYLDSIFDDKFSNKSKTQENIAKTENESIGIDLDSYLLALEEMFGKETKDELIKLFFNYYEKFEDELDLLDDDSLKNYVHKLKGSSGNLGFKEIYELCIDIEDNFEKDKDYLIAKLKEYMRFIMKNIGSYLNS